MVSEPESRSGSMASMSLTFIYRSFGRLFKESCPPPSQCLEFTAPTPSVRAPDQVIFRALSSLVSGGLRLFPRRSHSSTSATQPPGRPIEPLDFLLPLTEPRRASGCRDSPPFQNQLQNQLYTRIELVNSVLFFQPSHHSGSGIRHPRPVSRWAYSKRACCYRSAELRAQPPTGIAFVYSFSESDRLFPKRDPRYNAEAFQFANAYRTDFSLPPSAAYSRFREVATTLSTVNSWEKPLQFDARNARSLLLLCCTAVTRLMALPASRPFFRIFARDTDSPSHYFRS